MTTHRVTVLYQPANGPPCTDTWTVLREGPFTHKGAEELAIDKSARKYHDPEGEYIAFATLSTPDEVTL